MDKPLLELVRFFYSELPSQYEYPYHLHPFYQLDVVLEGRREIKFEGGVPAIDEAGDAWLIPPLLRHAYSSSVGYRHMLFHFHVAPRLWPLCAAGTGKYRIPPRLLEEIENCGTRAARGAPLAREQVAAVAALCLVECLDQRIGETPLPDNLDEFRHQLWPLLEAMEKEPYADWTLGRMAAECHLSAGYFSRCFLRVIRRWPHQYALEIRMRAVSADLLAMPELPIKEIADRAGYGTVQAFTRAFKRVFDITPAAYRNLPREEND